jgi:hypothetical protein
MSIHPDDGSTAYECPHHFDCAGECTLTDVPLPGTVATWLADIEAREQEVDAIGFHCSCWFLGEACCYCGANTEPADGDDTRCPT